MFSFNWIVKAISWLTSSPLIAAIVGNLISLLKDHGDDMAKFALDCIHEAAKSDISGVDKFTVVKDKVKEAFPDATSIALDTIVQSTFDYYANDLMAKPSV
jgi:hypothetical protein